MKKNATLTLLVMLFSFSRMHAQSFTPVHKLVIEDQTQCSSNFGQWSPRGIVRLDSFVNSTPGNMAEIISVHSNIGTPPNDLMTDSVYSNGCQYNTHRQMNSWPSFCFDRKIVNTEPDSVFVYFNQHTGDFGVADIGISLTYDTTTRALDVTANTHFAINAVQYNLALVLTEDSVHGTTIDYSQRNNYTGGTYGPMAGGGVDFVAQPDPVPAAVMYYRHVARAILPSFQGEDASLPDTAYADSSYMYTFPTYTVPVNYNASKMRAIVLLIDTINGEIKNANGADLTNPATGMHEVLTGVPSFSVFPNPFNEIISVKFSLPSAGSVSIGLSNNLGRNISEENLGTLTAGEHSFQLNGKDLAPGIYFITLKTNQRSLNKKIVLNR